MEISLTIYDRNAITANTHIGKFTVDVSYIYQMNMDHELYRRWVALVDTTDATEGIKGYMKITINVLGPQDRPKIHDETKEKR